MQTPTDRKFAKSHEWVKIEGTTATVGITDHAQDALGDITFVEMPTVGKKVEKGKEFGVVESVKAASDLYCPVSGEVTAVNTALSTRSELMNKDPYESGWIIKLSLSNPDEAKILMDGAAYDAFLKTEA